MINKLEVEISDDPITGLKRKLKHYEFIIDANLEMTHTREIVLYENINGQYGRPIIDVITQDPNLNDEQKQLKYKLFAPQRVTAKTHGEWVNQFGQNVEKTVEVLDEDGNVIDYTYPQGSMTELEFWQLIPKAYINIPTTKVSEDIYFLLTKAMKSMDDNSKV